MAVARFIRVFRDFDLAPYPAINAWLERVRSQPRFVPMPRR